MVQNASVSDEYRITVSEFLQSSFWKNRNLRESIIWPPDIFAFTSLIMKRTGCYKIALVDTTFWEGKDWQRQVKEVGEKWMISTGRQLVAPDSERLAKDFSKLIIEIPDKGVKTGRKKIKIGALWEELLEDREIDIDAFRTITTDRIRDFHEKKLYRLARNLFILHAVADAACVGIGLVGLFAEKHTRSSDKHIKVVHCLANLLLVATGSLATLSKNYGTVLPKMRTPQTGISLRSTSHHLSFHTTEVEVMWRAIPWPEDHQRSVNIMAVPFPYGIDESAFEPIEDQYHHVRYFKPRIQATPNRGFLKKVVHTALKKSRDVRQIHFLVFPEMSLTEKDYNYLLGRFEYSLKNDYKNKDVRFPVIVAGVVAENPVSGFIENKAKIASYFAGRWYDVSQRKHHRWQLDRSQIIQYDIQAKLSAERNWFEYASVSQRRLTVLAPNGWLAMTALICEDLARLEPVSEVIRGIGPTFLTALLSDGPQLNQRWAARYASVLADDPGTATLVMTSHGMVERSRKMENGVAVRSTESGKVVGLWKDMVKGARSLTINTASDEVEGSEKALLMTISADYRQEYTLDGRSDEYSAAVFQLDEVNEITIEENGGDEKGDVGVSGEMKGGWNDIRQLSAFVYTMNSAIDLNSDPLMLESGVSDTVFRWLKAETRDERYHTNDYLNFIIFKLTANFNNPELSGIDSDYHKNDVVTAKWSDDKEIGASIKAALEIFGKVKEQLTQDNEKTKIHYYETLIDKAIELYHSDLYNLSKFNELERAGRIIEHFLKNSKGVPPSFSDEEIKEFSKIVREHRIELAVPIMIAMLIDSKFSNWEIKFDSPDYIPRVKNIREKARNFIKETYNAQLMEPKTYFK